MKDVVSENFKKVYSLNLFISYSNKDALLCDALIASIKEIEKEGWIKIWYDKSINPADRWDPAIHQELQKADIKHYYDKFI